MMEKGKDPHRPLRKYPYSELSQRIFWRSIYAAPLYLCVFVGGIVYCIVDKQTDIAILLAAIGCFVLLEWLILFFRFHKKCKRFALLCISSDFPAVIVVQRAYGLNVLKADSIYIRFFRNSESARQYAAINALLLHQTAPKHLLQQAKKQRCTMEKTDRGDSFPYAPVDLYALQGKTVLIARNVIGYYGEPDSARLAQNGCTLSLLDDPAEETQVTA